MVKWSSEEVVIPYKCKTDGAMHRYFVDLYVVFANDKSYLVEVKPARQVEPPKKTPGKRKEVFMEEVLTYAKNVSKWTAAKAYAEARGMTFVIWTEHTIRKLGVTLLNEGRWK